MKPGNLFAGIATQLAEEQFDQLVSRKGVMIERIVSQGQGSTSDDWYDQERDEWVILIQGQAKLLFEEGDKIVNLNAGDYLEIPAHRRHKVIWTSNEQQCVWIAMHY